MLGLLPREAGGALIWTASMMAREAEKTKSQLSEQDARLLLSMSADLVALCAKFLRNFDPPAAAMLSYVRDEIAPGQKCESCDAKLIH